MEELYQQSIREAARRITKKVELPTTMYEGEHAFSLFLSCVSKCPGGYKFKVIGLEHDTLIAILVVVRNIILPSPFLVPKRTKLASELKHLGISHLSKYITEHKDKTYTLDIKPITYELIRFISKALFTW